jgi:hypothetical protein
VACVPLLSFFSFFFFKLARNPSLLRDAFANILDNKSMEPSFKLKKEDPDDDQDELGDLANLVGSERPLPAAPRVDIQAQGRVRVVQSANPTTPQEQAEHMEAEALEHLFRAASDDFDQGKQAAAAAEEARRFVDLPPVCDRCRRLHRKCDRAMPCSECRMRNSNCVTSSTRVSGPLGGRPPKVLRRPGERKQVAAVPKQEVWDSLLIPLSLNETIGERGISWAGK